MTAMQASSVRIVVGAPDPGGSSPPQPNAKIAGLLATQLRERRGRDATVEYMEEDWVASMVAPTYVARSEPDGRTVLLDYHVPTMNAALGKFALDELVPVTQVASRHWLFAVNPTVPAESLQAFVAYTQARPEPVKFTAYHVAAHGHLVIEELKRRTGANLVFEPAGVLADGISFAAASVEAIVSGKASFGTVHVDTAVPLIREGKLKPLAVTGPARSSLLPAVPTVTEAGVPDANISVWSGVWAPAGTPSDVVAGLSADIKAIVELPETAEELQSYGFEPAPSTTEQFAALIERDVARWKELIALTGIRAEDL